MTPHTAVAYWLRTGGPERAIDALVETTTSTAPVQAAPTGTRFYCAASVSDERRRSAHDSGDGKPPRKRCRYCKGELVSQAGTYGVFTWRGDGRYPLADAHATFPRESTADRYATRDTTYVVRWLVDIG
jgi:hypothetical protein